MKKFIFGLVVVIGLFISGMYYFGTKGDAAAVGEVQVAVENEEGRLATLFTAGLPGARDKIHINVFDDPTLTGVSCWLNLPDRAWNYDDQSNTSLACRQTGKVEGELVNQENVFKHRKGLFFKHMTVDRIYDEKRNTLIYVSYTKKLTGDNASSSISVVPVNNNAY